MTKATSIASALALAIFTTLLVTVPRLSEAQKGENPIIDLSSGEQVFGNTSFMKDVAARSDSNVGGFYLLGSDGQVYVYDSQHKLIRTIPTYVKAPVSIAVDSEGRFYVSDAGDNQVKIFNSQGKIVKTFATHPPNSISLLSNGNVVVASPFNGFLLHVYDSSGRELRSFGKIKQFDSGSVSQNNFLNRGKVLIDSLDTIYYMYEFAPIPIIQRFTQKGKLLSEFIVAGDAVELQKDVAGEFLRRRSPNKIGGIRILNSMAIDQSNRLWIGMNGASNTGVVYEYKPNGKKLHEYRLQVDSSSYQWDTITSVSQLVVRMPYVYAFTVGGVFRFDRNGGSSALPRPIRTQDLCPVEVTFSDCKTPCGTTETNDDKDCKAELLASVNMDNRRIIETTCNQDANSCLAQIKTCKLSNGVQTTHNIQLQCNGGGGGGGEGGCGESLACDAPWGWDSVQCCCADSQGNCQYCPILIDVSGNGFDLTDATGGVDFDLNADGITEHLSWTPANCDDAFLVLDRNGNGTIDNGAELFGNFTPQPASSSRNGFIALAEFDTPANGGNGDGIIDGRDAIFPSLRLWQDTNHNGISESSELHTVTELGVDSISLDYEESRRRDQYGNTFRYRAKVGDVNGAHIARWAWDVFLVK